MKGLIGRIRRRLVSCRGLTMHFCGLPRTWIFLPLAQVLQTLACCPKVGCFVCLTILRFIPLVYILEQLGRPSNYMLCQYSTVFFYGLAWYCMGSLFWKHISWEQSISSSMLINLTQNNGTPLIVNSSHTLSWCKSHTNLEFR